MTYKVVLQSQIRNRFTSFTFQRLLVEVGDRMQVVQNVSNGRTASRNSVRSSWTGQNVIRVQAEKRAGVRNVVSRYSNKTMIIFF